MESVVRMAEASARMHLRDYVADADVNTAIKCDSLPGWFGTLEPVRCRAVAGRAGSGRGAHVHVVCVVCSVGRTCV